MPGTVAQIGAGRVVQFLSQTLIQSVDVRGATLKIPHAKVTNGSSTGGSVEKSPGKADGGQLTISFIRCQANLTMLYGMVLATGELNITYSDTSVFSSQAFLAEINPESMLEGVETVTAVWELTGPSTYG